MRYVVLHHTGWTEQFDHYDLMLQLKEGGDNNDLALKTFSTLCDEFPTGANARDITEYIGSSMAQPNLLRLISNHRLAYLSFQGPISQNRGKVERVDEGALMNFNQSLISGELHMRLSGRRLNGNFALKPLRQGIFCFAREKIA